MLRSGSKLAITVDVEDWYHVPLVAGSPFARYRDVPAFFAEWKSRYDYLSGPTADVLSMLGEKGVRATFFVVADVVEHYPRLVRRIAAAGHELACHGLHHSCVIDPRTKVQLMPRSEFEENTRTARSMLEDAIGKPV
ncbi:MAG: polysaccharide deacetylase family protein, partial [Candidatus Bipolaricaulia bacterium]